MFPTGKAIIIIGITLVIVGLMLSGKTGSLGRLPGDILISRPNFTIYIPFTSAIVVSIIVSVVAWLLRR